MSLGAPGSGAARLPRCGWGECCSRLRARPDAPASHRLLPSRRLPPCAAAAFPPEGERARWAALRAGQALALSRPFAALCRLPVGGWRAGLNSERGAKSGAPARRNEALSLRLVHIRARQKAIKPWRKAAPGSHFKTERGGGGGGGEKKERAGRERETHFQGWGWLWGFFFFLQVNSFPGGSSSPTLTQSPSGSEGVETCSTGPQHLFKVQGKQPQERRWRQQPAVFCQPGRAFLLLLPSRDGGAVEF